MYYAGKPTYYWYAFAAYSSLHYSIDIGRYINRYVISMCVMLLDRYITAIRYIKVCIIVIVVETFVYWTGLL